jgi:hypothetical protein
MSQEGFTAEQIAHAAASTLDLFIRGPFKEVGIQDKPLLKIFESGAEDFNGAKEVISLPVRFDRGANGVNDGVKGYSHNQTVGFYNPNNGRRANYVWREMHHGMTMTETELKQQGILVGNEFGSVSRSAGDRSLVVLTDIMMSANKDFMERYAETMNTMMWGDGTADPSGLHGLLAFIADIPTLGTTGGISRATNPKWRNRARTRAFSLHSSFSAAWGGDRVTSNVSNGGALWQELGKEYRQLRRFGAKPDTFLAGSDFIDMLEREQRANGNYSETGFTGTQDGSMGDLKFKDMPIKYDPTLDDMGRAKYGYMWDSKLIKLKKLAGDWKRMRDPARPYNQFVLHKSLVCTGQIVSDQLDGALVIEAA